MSYESFDEQVSGIAALGEPVRLALYRYVISMNRPVTRNEAADGVGVERHVAKFHLDRLEKEGLLETEFHRPPGRGGPGAGRSSKHYRRASRQISVSLPERRYDLAGRIMATAIARTERDGSPISVALREAATSIGRSMGAEARDHAGAQPGDDALLAAAHEVLERYGYEPRDHGSTVTLANCPFHALAEDFTDLVCGMNLDLLRGFIAGLGTAHIEARLDPAPGRCCVTVCQ